MRWPVKHKRIEYVSNHSNFSETNDQTCMRLIKFLKGNLKKIQQCVNSHNLNRTEEEEQEDFVWNGKFIYIIMFQWHTTSEGGVLKLPLTRQAYTVQCSAFVFRQSVVSCWSRRGSALIAYSTYALALPLCDNDDCFAVNNKTLYLIYNSEFWWHLMVIRSFYIKFINYGYLLIGLGCTNQTHIELDGRNLLTPSPHQHKVNCAIFSRQDVDWWRSVVLEWDSIVFALSVCLEWETGEREPT